MARYDDEQKKTAFVVSFIMIGIGCALCYWLYSNDWSNLRQSFQIEFCNFNKLAQITWQPLYGYFLLGLIILHEASMLICRYLIGLQGKKCRLYLSGKKGKIGLHHYHWGIVILVSSIIATSPLLTAIGISCIVSDVLHHQILRLFHGDPEGDGPLRNPFYAMFDSLVNIIQKVRRKRR